MNTYDKDPGARSINALVAILFIVMLGAIITLCATCNTAKSQGKPKTVPASLNPVYNNLTLGDSLWVHNLIYGQSGATFGYGNTGNLITGGFISSHYGQLYLGVPDSDGAIIQFADPASAYSGQLQTNTLTGNRTYSLPDATGTLALTSQIGTVGTRYHVPISTGTAFVSSNITDDSAGTVLVNTRSQSDGVTLDITDANTAIAMYDSGYAKHGYLPFVLSFSPALTQVTVGNSNNLQIILDDYFSGDTNESSFIINDNVKGVNPIEYDQTYGKITLFGPATPDSGLTDRSGAHITGGLKVDGKQSIGGSTHDSTLTVNGGIHATSGLLVEKSGQFWGSIGVGKSSTTNGVVSFNDGGSPYSITVGTISPLTATHTDTLPDRSGQVVLSNPNNYLYYNPTAGPSNVTFYPTSAHPTTIDTTGRLLTNAVGAADITGSTYVISSGFIDMGSYLEVPGDSISYGANGNPNANAVSIAFLPTANSNVTKTFLYFQNHSGRGQQGATITDSTYTIFADTAVFTKPLVIPFGTPSSHTAVGVQGQVMTNAVYFYRYTGTAWGRIAISDTTF